MKSNISISVDERYNELIQSIREDADKKGQSVSYAILSLLEKAKKPKSDFKLTLESSFEEWQKFAQNAEIDEMKKISHQSHVVNICLEAFIKWDSYEGKRGEKSFPNARKADNYLHR